MISRHSFRRVRGAWPALVLLGAAWAAGPEIPRIGNIELYGAGKVSAARILHEAKLQAGDSLPASKGDLEERIEQIPGVQRARVEAVCCEDAGAILFIGVEEKEGAHATFRSQPAGKAVLPEDVAADYRQFVQTVRDAIQQKAASDAVNLSTANAARGLEEKLAAYSGQHMADLRDVLRNSDDADQRAMAAGIIGYAPRKAPVVDDLQYALQDPDESVRSNALRSMRDLAAAGVRDPSLGIHISPTWLVELLKSLVLADRLEAADILVTLTDRHEATVLALMKERALRSLAEMAQWQSLRYALPPFILVGRIAGLEEREIQDRWTNGDREAVILKALGKTPRKK